MRAVDEREAFLRAQRYRLQTRPFECGGAGHALVAEVRFAFADERKRHMRQWCEIAAGSDGTLARDDRRDAAIEQFDDEIERLEFDS